MDQTQSKINDYGQQLQALGQSLPPISASTNLSDDATVNTTKTAYKGLCQAFVEATIGSGWKGGSAIQAWQNQQDKAVPSLNGIKPGDPIYFAADRSNGGYGHTGIYMGNGNFLSATDNGIQNLPLNDWIKATDQHILGYLKEK